MVATSRLAVCTLVPCGSTAWLPLAAWPRWEESSCHARLCRRSTAWLPPGRLALRRLSSVVFLTCWAPASRVHTRCPGSFASAGGNQPGSVIEPNCAVRGVGGGKLFWVASLLLEMAVDTYLSPTSRLSTSPLLSLPLPRPSFVWLPGPVPRGCSPGLDRPRPGPPNHNGSEPNLD